MRYKFIILIICIFTHCVSWAQSSVLSNYGGFVYKFNGFGVSYQKKFETNKNIGKQFEIEFETFKHEKETKTFNSEIANSTPFVFGKLNKTAILKAQYFITKNISQFTDEQRVGIDLVMGGGIAIGILKPVYLNMIYPDGGGFEIIVSEKYNPLKHTDITRIAGYSDFRTGLGETTYKTGITASTGIGFTWGYYNNFPKRIEIGCFLEFFRKGLPVMAFAQNKPIQKGVYVKIFFGKRIFNN
ncbi:MAG: hypothetical protein HUU47_07335 [Bacteroidetes bacterium]|nr:hypothetical protein [Bacteroidota bacterium]